MEVADIFCVTVSHRFRMNILKKYLSEKELNLTATLDAEAAYSDADFVVIVTPMNVYIKLSVAT